MADTDDRALLELAARAAGINWQDWTRMCGSPRYEVWPYDWNPILDDGDNRRLQISLNLGLVPLEGGGWDCIEYGREEIVLASDFDPNRAVVRAAAELGRAAAAIGAAGADVKG